MRNDPAMKRRNHRALVAGVLTTVAAAGLAVMAGAESGRLSGTVLAVDVEAGTLVIGAVGPWRVTNGETVITPLTVHFGPATRVVWVERDDDLGPTGWPGQFAEIRVSVRELRVGDFATVKTDRQDERLRAREITVVRPGGREN
jgi:hypothetical protein